MQSFSTIELKRIIVIDADRESKGTEKKKF